MLTNVTLSSKFTMTRLFTTTQACKPAVVFLCNLAVAVASAILLSPKRIYVRNGTRFCVFPNLFQRAPLTKPWYWGDKLTNHNRYYLYTKNLILPSKSLFTSLPNQKVFFHESAINPKLTNTPSLRGKSRRAIHTQTSKFIPLLGMLFTESLSCLTAGQGIKNFQNVIKPKPMMTIWWGK